MRAKRFLIAAAGAFVLALGLACAAAFAAPVQTWIARRVLVSQFGAGASLQSASVGLQRISLVGLHLEREGAVLDAPALDARVGVLSVLFGRNLSFSSLVARGWTLDLAHGRGGDAASRAGTSGDGRPSRVAEAAEAALKAFNLPSRTSLDGVDLEGVVLLADAENQPVGRAQVVVTGGGLAAGRTGLFQCDAQVVPADAASPVSSVSVWGTLTASIDALGTFTRADLKLEARAIGPNFPGGIGLSGTATAAREAGRLSYSLAFGRGDELIASIDAQGTAVAGRFTGSWRLNVKDTDLAPFALGRRLPAFSAAGDGGYDVDAASGAVHARGSVRATAGRLGLVADALSPLGTVQLASDFDMALAGSSLRVDRLETTLTGSAPVASVRSLQPFEFNTATGELKVGRPTGDLVGISVLGIPMAWIARVLPAGYEIQGGDFQGEFAMRAENGRLALRTRSPLSTTGVTLARKGRIVATGLDVAAFLMADYASQGWQIQLAPFSVRCAGVRLLSLEARLGRLLGEDEPMKAEGSWSVSIPVLASQAPDAFADFSAGEASGSFEANLGTTPEVRVKLAVKDLALASAGSAELPSIAAEIRADFGTDGTTTFSVPLHINYGTRASEVLLGGTATTDENGLVVDGTFTGARLYPDDLRVTAALCGSRLPGPVAPAVGAVSAPPRSAIRSRFWPSGRGRVALHVDTLVFPAFEVSDIRGILFVQPDSVRIADGTAGLGDSSGLRLAGTLALTDDAAHPFHLEATAAVDNLDSARLFRFLDPSTKPAVEGRFDATASVHCNGAGLGELADEAQGEFRLSSKGGFFRVLQAEGVDPSKGPPSRLIGAIDTVTALFGRKGDKAVDALVDSANDLSEVHYDQMNIQATRGADLDLDLTDISMISPEVRLSGKGEVTHAAEAALRDQPFSADLDIGVRGRAATLLDLLGMLGDGQDELGYSPLSQPVHLGGTLGRIDASQWKDALMKASLRKAGGLLDKLMGK